MQHTGFVLRYVPIPIGLLILITLLPNLPPGITFVDSAQLCIAAQSMGIAHPSGYPLWCLWDNLGLSLFCGVDTALWGAIASAIMLSATAAILARLGIALARRAGWQPGWQMAAGLIVAIASISNRIVLAQGLEVEVYSLNLVIVSLLVLIVLSENPTPRHLLIFSFLAGLGLANHSSILLPLIPLSIYLMLKVRRFALLPIMLIAILLGLSVWLYLPLRSSTNPIFSWGWPDSLERFWAHASRAVYGGMQFHRLSFIWHSFTRLGESLIVISNIPLLLASALGGVFLLRNNRRNFWLIITLLFFTGIVAVTLLTAMLQPHQNKELLTWLAPFYLLLSFLAGWGLIATAHWLWMRFGKKTLIAWTGGIVGAAIAAFPFLFNLAAISKMDYYYAEDYAHDLLTTRTYRSILMMSGMSGEFESLYLAKVRHLRPDCQFADTTATVLVDRTDYNTYHQLNDQGKLLWTQAREKELLDSNVDCFYGELPNLQNNQRYSSAVYGMLHIVKKNGEPHRDGLEPFTHYRLHSLQRNLLDDEQASLVKVRYYLYKGMALHSNGMAADARSSIDKARAAAQCRGLLLASVAEGYLSLGEWRKAADTIDEALNALDVEIRNSPEFAPTVGILYFNMSMALDRCGDESGSQAAMNKALQIAPQLRQISNR